MSFDGSQCSTPTQATHDIETSLSEHSAREQTFPQICLEAIEVMRHNIHSTDLFDNSSALVSSVKSTLKRALMKRDSSIIDEIDHNESPCQCHIMALQWAHDRDVRDMYRAALSELFALTDCADELTTLTDQAVSSRIDASTILDQRQRARAYLGFRRVIEDTFTLPARAIVGESAPQEDELVKSGVSVPLKEEQ